MAQLIVRNIDDAIVARLKALAERNGISMEAQHRKVLEEAVAPLSREEMVRMAKRLQEETAGRGGPDSVTLIREMREERDRVLDERHS